MATVTVVLKKDYKSKDGTYPLLIRLASDGKIRYHNTSYKMKESQLDNGIVKKHPDADVINAITGDLVNKAKRYFADCALHDRPVNISKVFVKHSTFDFAEYLTRRGEHYRQKGKIIMWQKLSRYEKEITECFGKLYLDEVNADKLRTLEAFLVKNGNKPNTIGKKFGMLRQMFGAAKRESGFPGINPFENYKITTYPTRKEKLTIAEIKAIEDLKLTGATNDARNLFLFSFYAKGARFENCIFIERENIRDGRIYFHTNKGQKYLSVLITRKLQAILDQYLTGKYVFPYIKETPADQFSYRSIKDVSNTIVNRHLKVIAGLAQVKIPLTFHIARHSIAMAMKRAKIDIYAIKEALGHSDTRTTEIYLKGLDDEVVDEEMRKIYGD